jgi:hypothetical protein
MAKSRKIKDEDDDEDRPAHVCVVYDPKTGRVAHVHEFYGTGFNEDDCERAALDTVASLGHVKTTGLKVLHPPELNYEQDTMLRVNPKSLELVAKKKIRRGGRKKK